ncbi:GTP-binding protein HflX [Halanaerobium saccharolyticum]|uniref:GTPase HflX n=2 Tax=Halanaerobium saccharolyticum TaxID=43595 RepID=A0A4R7YZV5_9FIRM|nr:GTPase HflX [Halanaerobium saccharolyticum]RAK07109.1 GTP-binding protein HflX [Halanaerobium saccharolyticum]TDW01879.1 GTP-binding protein HflX [Halanaerobium saccharolyticum]TDX53125.1 GTP-binding protein HflX [Halanaerobium saccharolyticum]
MGDDIINNKFEINENNDMYQIEEMEEKAVLVGLTEGELKELELLVETAGAESILKMTYHDRKIDPAYYIGSGKVTEIKEAAETVGANLIVFDNELSPVQQRNLEDKIEVKVIDRSQVILDIFARHAHSRESKIQVELAQLEYRLPRLQGRGVEMSRLAGGIGTRGPGETKLEVDRRRIEKKIHRLQEKLKEIKASRELQRSRRKDPLVALVGYTNAGKSTLMNRLAGADSYTADKLFATLDSTMRQLELPVGQNVILSDTVGFISKLPHQLVASFRTTLEEVENADIILHLIDASNSEMEKNMRVVNNEIRELVDPDCRIIKVFNKIDLIEESRLDDLKIIYPEALFISALKGINTDSVIEKLNRIISEEMVEVELDLPYSEAGWVEKIHNTAKVYEEEYQKNNIYIKALLPQTTAAKLDKYRREV